MEHELRDLMVEEKLLPHLRYERDILADMIGLLGNLPKKTAKIRAEMKKYCVAHAEVAKLIWEEGDYDWEQAVAWARVPPEGLKITNKREHDPFDWE